MRKLHPRKRVPGRVPSNIEVKFLFKSKVYSGTVLNLSKRGMSIRADWNVPVGFDEHLDVLILHKKKRMMVPVKIERLEATDTYSNVLNVEVLNPSDEYLELAGGRGPVYKAYSSITRRFLKKIN